MTIVGVVYLTIIIILMTVYPEKFLDVLTFKTELYISILLWTSIIITIVFLLL